MTVSGKLCCVVLPFCCVVVVALPFSASLEVIVRDIYIITTLKAVFTTASDKGYTPIVGHLIVLDSLIKTMLKDKSVFNLHYTH